MRYLIPLILVSQIIIFPQLSFRWCKEASMQAFIIVLLSSLIWQKNKCLSLFILWSFVLFLLGRSFIVNDYGIDAPSIMINLPAFISMINIVLIGVLYYFLRTIKIDRDMVYKAFAFVAVFQSIYIIIQALQLDQFFFNISQWLQTNPKRVCWTVGTWGNEALVSWCIAICSPYLLAFKGFRYKAGYVISFIAVLLTKCTFGLVGFVGGFIFWLFFKSWKSAVALLILLALVGGVFYINGSLTEYFNPTHRFEVWKKSIDIWKEKPMTGQGLGSYRVLFWQRAPEFRSDGHWAQAHNEYIQLLFESGIIGLGLMLALMWITFYQFLKSGVGVVPITCLVITAIIALAGFPFRTAMGVIPLISLALFERELYGTAI